MEGLALPAIGVSIDNRVYPLSFRNMANVIIEHYASQKMDIDCSDAISNFISQRFESIIEEPFLLLSKKRSYLINSQDYYRVMISFIYLLFFILIQQVS